MGIEWLEAIFGWFFQNCSNIGLTLLQLTEIQEFIIDLQETKLGLWWMLRKTPENTLLVIMHIQIVIQKWLVDWSVWNDAALYVDLDTPLMPVELHYDLLQYFSNHHSMTSHHTPYSF